MNLANKRIGAVVRSIRKEKKMAQLELGKRMGLHQSAISRIESGEQALTAVEGFRICQILGVPHYKLFLNMSWRGR